MGVAILLSALVSLQKADGAAGHESYRNVPAHSENSVTPADKRPARVDRHGESLPRGAVARMGTLRLRQGGAIGQFAFSPDSKILAAASNDDAVSLWNVTTGQEIRRLQRATAGGDPGVAFSPNGKIMATGQYSKVRRWNTATWDELPPFPLQNSTSGRLMFSPDGAILACCGTSRNESQNTLVFLDASTGQELHRLTGLKQYKRPEIAFSPDSKTWAYVNRKDPFVWVYDSRTGKEIHRLEGHTAAAETAAFSPDGQTLASTDGIGLGTLRFWDAASGKLSPKTGRLRAGENLCYSPDGKLLAGGDFSGRRLQLYDLGAERVRSLEERAPSEHPVLFSPDGKWLASAYEHCVYLWDRETGNAIHHVSGHERQVRAVAFAPDGKTVLSVAGELGTISRWEATTGKELPPVGGLQDYVYALASSADGRMLAAGTGNHDGTVWLLDSATGKHLGKLVIPKGYVTSVAFSADGKTIASKYQRETRIWDLSTRQLLHTVQGGPFEFTDVALSTDGRIIANGEIEGGGIIHVRDVATGNDLLRLEGHRGVYAVAFGPVGADGKTLASAGFDGIVQLWDVGMGKQLWQAAGHQGWSRFVAFSGDGKTLASGGTDKVVRLWETATGKERGRFEGHRHAVACGAFSPDNRLLATGSADTTVLVWDLCGGPVAGPRPPLSPEALSGLWADLAGDDARTAYQAIGKLAEYPAQSVPFLKQHLRTIHPANAERTAVLIADLDSKQFAVRDKAGKLLEALGESARPFLTQALKGPTSAEMRRRLERLLAKCHVLTPDRLRTLRVLEALERISNQESRGLLEDLAKGVSEARQTQEARLAVERLARRVSVLP